MTKIVRRRGLLVLILVLTIFATQGAAQDKPLKKIYWGVSTLSPTLWIPWIAKEAKIFEKNGLDVEAVLLNGSGGLRRLCSRVVCSRRPSRCRRLCWRT